MGAPPPAGAADVWSTQVRLGMDREQLWDVMFLPSGRTRWLGRDQEVGLKAGRGWSLGRSGAAWVRGRCRSVARPSGIVVDLTADADDGDGAGQGPTLRIDLSEAWDGTVVTVTQTVPDASTWDLVSGSWADCLRRLERLVDDVKPGQRPIRQAVIVIHGIGEQEPGSTLSALTASGVLVAPGGDASDRYVKPDLMSESFELRRVQFDQTVRQPQTRVFELYWAHLLRDTTMSQVTSWLRGLLLRWPPPRTLRIQWWLVWAVLAVAGTLAVASYLGAPWARAFAAAAIVAAVARTVWRVMGRVVALQVVGDAARYLVPRPGNIARRQAVREAGVRLLERLHESGQFDRIVVVGHSLGSVIAYDILTHAWVRLHRRHGRPTGPRFSELRAVERAITGGAGPDEAQRLQWEAWRRTRANTQPWLVTDLVTVGSPLAHADFLMADSTAAFEQAKQDRVLPTCPPVTEVEEGSGHRRVSFEAPYGDPIDGSTRTFTQLHHAAMFGVMRWTNLYFRVRRLGLGGDLVGGPVAPMFGSWVKDVELESPWRGFAHTRYWQQGPPGREEHLRALRRAMHLESRRALSELDSQMPAAARLRD